ncbi:MAG: hypothetical protein ABI040_02855 [Rhodoferax sp.]
MNRQTVTAAVGRQRNAGRTQVIGLAAYRDEFAPLGLFDARIDGMAVRVGINKRLIYYFSCEKDWLPKEAMEQAYRGIRGTEKRLRLLTVMPVDFSGTAV